MATALGYQSHLSVEKIFRDPHWLLVIIMSVSDSLASSCDGEGESLETPVFYATVEANQHLDTVPGILLSPSNDDSPEWQAIRTIRIDSERFPPKITVNFWYLSNGRLGDKFKIGVCEAIVCGTSIVSSQISLRSNITNLL